MRTGHGDNAISPVGVAAPERHFTAPVRHPHPDGACPPGEHFRPKLLADVGGGTMPSWDAIVVSKRRHVPKGFHQGPLRMFRHSFIRQTNVWTKENSR